MGDDMTPNQDVLEICASKYCPQFNHTALIDNIIL